MSSADALITRDGPVAVPMDYDVPAASEIVPISISATFADPTNAGPYVPALEIVTPSGYIIGPFPLGQDIAAGASARVSWFPGLAGSGQQVIGAGAGCALVLTANIAVVDGFAFTVVSWDAAVWDDLGFFNHATQPTRLTCPVDGRYHIYGMWNMTTSQVGDVGINVQRNGIGVGTISPTQIGWGETQFGINGNYHAAVQAQAVSKCVAGDYWEMAIEQKTGAARTVDATSTCFVITLLAS